DLTPRPPHHPARARAMISLFMQGGPSHLDLLDPKPTLTRYDGKPFPGAIKYDNAAQASSKVLASPWKFRRHGRSGIDVSELPSAYQGTVVRPREPRILNLDPPAHLKGVPQEHYLKYLARLNRDHLAAHPGELDLEARLAGYALAARMQTAAAEALDLSRETA